MMLPDHPESPSPEWQVEPSFLTARPAPGAESADPPFTNGLETLVLAAAVLTLYAAALAATTRW